MSKNKRYNLNLPLDLYERINQTAKDEGVTTAHLMRVFLRLGLKALKDDVQVVVVDDKKNREREVMILL